MTGDEIASVRSDLEGAEQVIERLRLEAEHERRRRCDEADARDVERIVLLVVVGLLLVGVM